MPAGDLPAGGAAGDLPACGVAGDLPAGGAAGDLPACGATGDLPAGGAAGDLPACGAAGDLPAGGAAGDPGLAAQHVWAVCRRVARRAQAAQHYIREEAALLRSTGSRSLGPRGQSSTEDTIRGDSLAAQC